jgi:hypothetical protein
MDRIYVRTCSSNQAAILARAAGRRARVGSSQVLIHRPSGREPIEPATHLRYLACVEALDAVPDPYGCADADVTEVVSALFGPYLGDAERGRMERED